MQTIQPLDLSPQPGRAAARRGSPAPYFLLALLVIGFDQLSKYLVHSSSTLTSGGQILLLGHWLKLQYTTNPGMAFGVELPPPYGKLLLTAFRLAAVSGLIFYGIIYHNAPPGSPTPWLFGQVIDMIYVDIYEGFLPAAWPLLGGKYVSLWPIFNLADSSIFIGVALILLLQGRFFKQEQQDTTEAVVSEPV